MRREGGWLTFVVLVALAVGALVLTIISGPKSKQVSEVTTLAPFYQKDAFLIAVVRSDQEQRAQDIELAKRLIAEKYVPIDDSGYSVPSDVIVGMEKDGIAVTPGPFFCRGGQYADANLPVFQAKSSDEAFMLIEAIARTQQKVCGPIVQPLKKAT